MKKGEIITRGGNQCAVVDQIAGKWCKLILFWPEHRLRLTELYDVTLLRRVGWRTVGDIGQGGV